jgi:hypothetical protein
LKKKKAYEITLLSVCLPPRPQQLRLATTVFSGFTVPAFRRLVTLRSKVVGRGVLYAVRVVANSYCVVKGKQGISYSLSFLLESFVFNFPRFISDNDGL